MSLFIGCFNDTLFPDTGRAVVEVRERLGVDVNLPLAQTCCGQMHNNSGYGADAGRVEGVHGPRTLNVIVVHGDLYWG